MRFLAPVAAILFGITVALIVTREESSVMANEQVVEPIYPMTYRIMDLPVWSQDGKTFDPSILIALLEVSVNSKTWDGTSTMRPYPDKSMLVVATTSENHKSIGRILKDLRNATRR